MKVYVVEQGCYSDRWVVGVWADVEKAKASFKSKGWTVSDPRETHPDACRSWNNGLDWDDAIYIYEMEVAE